MAWEHLKSLVLSRSWSIAKIIKKLNIIGLKTFHGINKIVVRLWYSLSLWFVLIFILSLICIVAGVPFWMLYFNECWSCEWECHNNTIFLKYKLVIVEYALSFYFVFIFSTNNKIHKNFVIICFSKVRALSWGLVFPPLLLTVVNGVMVTSRVTKPAMVLW